MLTKLTLHNFKRFADADVGLGKSVVLVGPNNCGKTTVLQALTLWDIGVKRWIAKRGGRPSPEKRPGVTINRRDLIAVPVPDANLLWRDLKVRKAGPEGGTENVRVEITVEGVSEGREWVCGLEFDYANEESFYCRALRTGGGSAPGDRYAGRMPIPEAAQRLRVAYLPPMSGLAAQEEKRERGAVNVLIGEGRTAEVLRNLCYQITQEADGSKHWGDIVARMKSLFGVTLDEPQYITERGEITLSYKDGNGVRLDLSAAGRGLQQTLLLLAYIYANPGAVLLLDEPDAHLEILRQRQTYSMLSEAVEQRGGQVIVASHSEVILQEAAERAVVVAFVGPPHRINDRGSQLFKALKAIAYEDYIQAQQRGWVLYLEGSSDLAILRAFAETLQHEASRFLESPFVHYVGNVPSKALYHFHGLREAKPDLAGVALFDRMDPTASPPGDHLKMLTWTRCEIENYLAYPEVLVGYAARVDPDSDDLFGRAEAEKRRDVMRECIKAWVPPQALTDRAADWWTDTRMSDAFLPKVFKLFYQRLGLPDAIDKADYCQLARVMPRELIAQEVREKLDAVVDIARRARPAKGADVV